MKNKLLTDSSVAKSTTSWGQFYHDPDLGDYSVTNEASTRIPVDDGLRNKVTVFILEARLRNETRAVAIFVKERPPLDELKHWLVSIDEAVNAWPREAVEMIDRALVNLSRLATWPGDEIKITKQCAWLLYSQSADQRDWMVRQLESSGYVRFNEPQHHDDKATLNIETTGWQQISELLRKPKTTYPEAFVAMWFTKEMQPFFDDGFRPAIESDGKTKCIRIDRVDHNNKICDEIIAAIRRCRYVVADFTGNRGGVYYEAGFAHGLGIPVIWTVKDSAKDLHFDTRQYNHIVYKTPEDLKTALQNRIAATIA